MTIHLSVPQEDTALKPRITVIGVGGAGGNAVNNMIASKLEGVEFLVANTDAQSLLQSQATRKIQLGHNITHGLGAGSRPEIGRAAAEEVIDEIAEHLQATNMVFVTAGMGGGTGTGAAPVIARLAREHGILTVGVVTKPFHFEGANRARIAEAGIQEMQQYVDTLIVIPNQNLFRVANEKTTFADAFAMADQVLHSGVRGITDLMVVPGLINLDFADIRTVMSEMGKAMMGTGEADGEDRATRASEAAISNPLLDEVSMKGARGVLINITGGADMTLFEVDEAANRIGEEVDPEANIIFGSTLDPSIEGKMRVSVVATGIEAESVVQPRPILKVVPRVEPERREPEPPAVAETPAEAPTPAASEPERTAAVDVADMPAKAAPELEAEPAPPPAIDILGDAVARREPAGPSVERGPSLEADRPGDGRPEHEERDEPERRRGPSLLQRMASAGRARRGREPDDVEPVIAPVVEPVVARQPSPVRAAPPPPATPVAPRLPEQSHFDDVRASERPPSAGGEEDLLDIPAFLRRQAN